MVTLACFFICWCSLKKRIIIFYWVKLTKSSNTITSCIKHNLPNHFRSLHFALIYSHSPHFPDEGLLTKMPILCVNVENIMKAICVHCFTALSSNPDDYILAKLNGNYLTKRGRATAPMLLLTRLRSNFEVNLTAIMLYLLRKCSAISPTLPPDTTTVTPASAMLLICYKIKFNKKNLALFASRWQFRYVLDVCTKQQLHVHGCLIPCYSAHY